MTYDGDVPDGPHEVIAHVMQDVRAATTPPPRSIAKVVVVLAVTQVLASALSLLAIIGIQSQRAATHRQQVKINTQQSAVNSQVKINTEVARQLAAEQDQLAAQQAAIPSQIDARLCSLTNTLTPPNAPVTAQSKAFRREIHCPLPPKR